MANIRSQIKRNRQNEKRRLRNRDTRGAARTAVRNAFQSITAGEESKTAVASAITSLDKAARKGAIHPRNAARRKSRLMKRLAGIAPKAASAAGAAQAEMPAAAAVAKKKAAVRKASAKKTAKK